MATDLETPQFPEEARCSGCNYALRGLARNICPECGRAFDPANPATFRVPRRRINWRRLARPPSLLAVLATLAITGCHLNERSLPFQAATLTDRGLSFPISLWAVPGWLIVFYWLRAVIAFAYSHESERDPRVRPKGRWRWVVLPICAVFCGSATVTQWPLWLRFELSRPAFERAARKQLQISDVSDDGPCWIGLYYVRRIARTPTPAVFFVVDDGSREARQAWAMWTDGEGGFAFRPAGRHARSKIDFGGGWYGDVWWWSIW